MARSFCSGLATVVSYAFHPVWVPSAVVVFSSFCWDFVGRFDFLLLFGFTLFFTFGLPSVLFVFLMRRGMVDSIYMSERVQRNIPYVVTLCFYVVWVVLLCRLFTVPAVLFSFGVSLVLSSVFLLLINQAIKVSAHLYAFGCLWGMIASLYTSSFFSLPAYSYILVSFFLFLTFLLMWARWYLRAHTVFEIVVAFVIGFVSFFFTFVT